MKPIHALLLLVGGVSLAAQPVIAQTIDFDEFASSTTVFHANNLAVDGFEFNNSSGSCTTGCFVTWGSAQAHYAGSPGMFNNFVDAVTRMTRVGGGTFDIFSIALANVFANGGGSTVTFKGTRADATTIFQSFVLGPISGSPAFATYLFDPGFSSLASLEWAQTANFHQFDNITFGRASTVPEPMSMTLIASGLLGVAAARRRRRASSVTLTA